MRKMAMIGLVAMLFTASASAAIVNGDWNAGEAGWTRWAAPWGAGNWAVTANGPTPPEGTAFLNGGQQGSFGWIQIVACPESWICTVNADWAGDIDGAGWAEVMLWSTANPDMAANINRADVGNAADIAFKKDSWGMNPPTAWGWQPASASPHPGGNGGTVHSLGWAVVALKAGSVSGAAVWTSWDNIRLDCTPEPTAALLLGIPALFLRRRRA